MRRMPGTISSRIVFCVISLFIILAVVLCISAIAQANEFQTPEKDLSVETLDKEGSQNQIEPLEEQNFPKVEYTDQVSPDCLCITNIQDDKELQISLAGDMSDNVNLQWSLDLEEWNDIRAPSHAFDLAAGSSVYFKGNNPSGLIQARYMFWFYIDGSSSLTGNIMSLIDNGKCTTKAIPNNYCFSGLFKNNVGLVSAPKLPATTLTDSCYAEMFSGCTSLSGSIELPASTLENYCYDQMLEGTSLSEIIVGFNEWHENTSTNMWVSGIPSPGVFVCPEGLEEIYDESHIPEGWTVSHDIPVPESPEWLCVQPIDSGQNKRVGIYYSGAYVPEDHPCFEYSSDLENWAELAINESIELNGPLFFKGNNINGINTNSDYYYYFKTVEDDCIVSVSGNIMSLLDNGQATLTAIPCDYCFYKFFSGSNIVSVPELPATVLMKYCYSNMFQDCKSLIGAATLPATSLCEGCYDSMFSGCQYFNNLTVYFNDWPLREDKTPTATNDWLTDVSSFGYFTCPKDLEIPTTLTNDTVNFVPPYWFVKRIESPVEPLKEIVCDVSGYTGFYNDQEHAISISVSDPASGAKIEYSSDGVSYSQTPIKKKAAGIYTVWFRISHAGYITKTGAAIINIKPVEGTVSFEENVYSKNYGDPDPEFKVSFSISLAPTPVLYTDYILYREGGEEVNNTGESYPVHFKWIGSSNYSFPDASSSLTILKSQSLKLIAEESSMLETDDPGTLNLKAHMEGLKFQDSLEDSDYRVSIKNSENATSRVLTPELLNTSKFSSKYDLTNLEIVPSTLKVYSQSGGESSFDYSVETFNGFYDGQNHEVIVTLNKPIPSASVNYSLDGKSGWQEDPIQFKEVGSYNVYCKISAPDYGSATFNTPLNILEAKGDSPENINTESYIVPPTGDAIPWLALATSVIIAFIVVAISKSKNKLYR